MQTIKEQWERFRQQAIHPDAPPVQLREMSFAFYTGVMVMFGLMTEMGEMTGEEDGERKAGKALHAISEELGEWGEEQKARMRADKTLSN